LKNLPSDEYRIVLLGRVVEDLESQRVGGCIELLESDGCQQAGKGSGADENMS
jgi:hypothetical protein